MNFSQKRVIFLLSGTQQWKIFPQLTCYFEDTTRQDRDTHLYITGSSTESLSVWTLGICLDLASLLN